jgi:hypothetical protein
VNWWWKKKPIGQYARTPVLLSQSQQQHADLQRKLILSGINDDHPLWKTILSYADEHARNELQVALMPGLNDGERHYNAGRAASADDFATALRDLRSTAIREMGRAKAAE